MGDHILLIGAIAIGGLLLFSMVSFNSSITMHGFEKTVNVNLQEELQRTIRIIERDFRKVGYRTSPALAISAFSDTSIQFDGDINNDGTVETVNYYLGTSDQVSGTDNPYDRPLFRQIDGGNPMVLSSYVTKFSLKYFQSDGVETTTPQLIDCIEIRLDLSNPQHPVDHKNYFHPANNDTLSYYTVSWRTKITPPNMLLNN